MIINNNSNNKNNCNNNDNSYSRLQKIVTNSGLVMDIIVSSDLNKCQHGNLIIMLLETQDLLRSAAPTPTRLCSSG